MHVEKLEWLAMPFRFDTLGAATPLTRDEFIADQSAHAKKLRTAILADTTAPSALGVLASDEGQWVQGWLAALETAGLLRPAAEAPPIRLDTKVLSLNATLATGILLAKAGDAYRTQADLLGFFAKVQQWYGDTARWAGDPKRRLTRRWTTRRCARTGWAVPSKSPSPSRPTRPTTTAMRRKTPTSSASTSSPAASPSSNTCAISVSWTRTSPRWARRP